MGKEGTHQPDNTCSVRIGESIKFKVRIRDQLVSSGISNDYDCD